MIELKTNTEALPVKFRLEGVSECDRWRVTCERTVAWRKNHVCEGQGITCTKKCPAINE